MGVYTCVCPYEYTYEYTYAHTHTHTPQVKKQHSAQVQASVNDAFEQGLGTVPGWVGQLLAAHC